MSQRLNEPTLLQPAAQQAATHRAMSRPHSATAAAAADQLITTDRNHYATTSGGESDELRDAAIKNPSRVGPLLRTLMKQIAGRGHSLNAHTLSMIRGMMKSLHATLRHRRQSGQVAADDPHHADAERMVNVAEQSLQKLSEFEERKQRLPHYSLDRARINGMMPLLISGIRNLSSQAMRISRRVLKKPLKVN